MRNLIVNSETGKRISLKASRDRNAIFFFVKVFNIGYITWIDFLKYTNEREDFNLHLPIIFCGEICGVDSLSSQNDKATY